MYEWSNLALTNASLMRGLVSPRFGELHCYSPLLTSTQLNISEYLVFCLPVMVYEAN